MSRAPKIWIAAVGVAALVTVSAGAAFAVRDDHRPVAVSQPHVNTVEPVAAGALSILRAPRGEGDELPTRVAKAFAKRAPFGMNPALSRRSIGNMTKSVYVMPARDHVCVSLTIGDGASLICPALDDVVAGRDRGGTVALDGGDLAIFGLVPDGVSEVEIGTGAAGAIEVPVQSNAYYTVLPAGTPVRSLGYSGPSGPIDFEIGDPRRFLDGG